MRVMRSLLALFTRSRRGAVAVEFALIAPVMVIALIALADYGLMVYQNTQLSEAASAGARFALQPGNEDNDAGIQAAALAALPDSLDASVAVTRECRCPTGAAVDCGSTCSGDVTPGRYVRILVTCPYAMIFDYPYIGNVDSLRSHAVMRIPNG